jgi:hypothetical protein
MTPELENLLYCRYPEFFLQRTWSAGESCMARGCAVHDGWFAIIEACAETITNGAREVETPVSQAVQIKEKFGGLRIYVRTRESFDFGATMCAEALSYWVCEISGKPGRLTVDDDGWYKTRCPEKARHYGVIFRSAMPRPSSKKYPSILMGTVDVPYGWRRIADCMLGTIHRMDKAPMTIDRIAVDDDDLIVSTRGSVPDFAAGAIAFTKEVARRTDQKTGRLHVPDIPQSESHDGGHLS